MSDPAVPAQVRRLISLLVWLAFEAVAVVPALRRLTWQTVLYGVLSLTVIRMLPVALHRAAQRGRARRYG
jgi:sodium/hydrogen antiporter